MITKAEIKVIAVLLLMAACGYGGWWAQGKNMRLSISQAREAQQQATRDKEASDLRLSQMVANEILDELYNNQKQARQVTQEIDTYETSPDRNQCVMDPEWVRIHDTAAGVSPSALPSGLPDGAGTGAEGHDDADALRTVTENYRLCRTQLIKARKWQDWYCGLAAEDPRCE